MILEMVLASSMFVGAAERDEGAAAIDETTIYLIKAKEVFRSAKDKILRDLRGPGCAAHSTLGGIERLTRPLARAFNWARRPSAGSTGGA